VSVFSSEVKVTCKNNSHPSVNIAPNLCIQL
jgi:hypothetical protein